MVQFCDGVVLGLVGPDVPRACLGKAQNQQLGPGRLCHPRGVCMPPFSYWEWPPTDDIIQVVAVMHVWATFWAIQRGYGLPLASTTERDAGQVEKVRTGFTRLSEL